MKQQHIYAKVLALEAEHGTTDPFSILTSMGVKIIESTKYKNMKGFCTVMNGTSYVLINSFLDLPTKRIIAAHELGHLIFHSDEIQKQGTLFDLMQGAPMNMTEHEANCFAADLLIKDDDVIACGNDFQGDVFAMARFMETMPELLNLKISSMYKRGYDFKVPLVNDSTFLRNYPYPNEEF